MQQEVTQVLISTKPTNQQLNGNRSDDTNNIFQQETQALQNDEDTHAIVQPGIKFILILSVTNSTVWVVYCLRKA